MANKTIDMNKIRQVLRMHTQGKSKLLISQQTGVARNTVTKYVQQFHHLRMTVDEVNQLNDYNLNKLFSNEILVVPSQREKDLQLFLPKVEREIKRTGVTLQMMWELYRQQHPSGYAITQFYHHYNKWVKKTSPLMHMIHKAGDKMYVDFAGERLYTVDKETGELLAVEVFVAILGASQLTYVEATSSQKKEDFIIACENALHYFQGVPAAIVPDNLKSAVTKSSKYEPTLNETFADFAEHYQTALLPARAYRPRDKSLVEGAVKIVYNRIYTSIHNTTFFSLEELNNAIWQELEVHNNRFMKGRSFSRKQQFDEVEKAALMPLPRFRYEFKKQQILTVMKNGHICLSVDKHYYSVPYKYISKKVKVIYSPTKVEIYYRFEMIASHTRIKSPYNYTTVTEHLASAHKFVSEWTPEKFITWAEVIHPDVKTFITNILERKKHPEQSYKSCIGVLSFEKKVGKERLIWACQRALDYGIYNYKIIQNILDKKMDQFSDDEKQEDLVIPIHENIRGEEYYQ
jgi:transposase